MQSYKPLHCAHSPVIGKNSYLEQQVYSLFNTVHLVATLLQGLQYGDPNNDKLYACSSLGHTWACSKDSLQVSLERP